MTGPNAWARVVQPFRLGLPLPAVGKPGLRIARNRHTRTAPPVVAQWPS